MNEELPPEVEGLAQVIQKAQAALRNARLYGLDHPETATAVDATFAELSPLLLSRGEVELRADMEGLSWGQWRLSSETESKEGLGRHIHREGISTLILEQNLTAPELGRLLGILGMNLSLPEYEEETLDHLLWQSRLEGVTYRAVRSLREAEALSGDVDNLLENKHDALMQELLGGAEPSTERRQVREISEDAVHRAVDGAEVQGIADDLADLDDPDGEDDEFEELDGDEEQQIIAARLKSELDEDDAGALLVDQLMLLLRVGTEGFQDLPADEAFQLVDRGVDEIYQRKMPVALLRLVDRGEEMLEMPPTFDEGRIQTLERCVRRAFKPMRVARMLVDLEPASTLPEADLKDLLERLDDADFAAFLAWASEEPPERSQWLMWKIGHLTVHRVERWVEDGSDMQYERLARAVQMLAAAGSDQDSLRRSLLQHPGWPVRQATLGWYASGLPSEDRQLVVDRLIDRHPLVREAAIQALAAHPDADTPHWLRGRIQEKAFSKRDPGVKESLCVALGRLGGERAVRTLEEVVKRRLPVFGNNPVHENMTAAVAGLVAVGSQAAIDVLDHGAATLSPARRSACRAALKTLRGGR